MKSAPRSTIKLRSLLIPLAALASTALSVSVSEAGAVSARVRVACASDYFAHCRAHAVGTPGVRQCMRAAGPKLSKRCINALVSSGEVSASEVGKREAKLH